MLYNYIPNTLDKCLFGEIPEWYFLFVQQVFLVLLLMPLLRCELLIVCTTHGGDNEAINQKHNFIKGEHDNDNYD